jgi:hypothetical protein
VKIARKQKKIKEPERLKPIPLDAALLSLDVSSSCIGFCWFQGRKIVEFGAIKSPLSWESKRRIAANADSVLDLAGKIYAHERAFDPIWVVMEWNSHKSAARCVNAQGLCVLGQAQGAVWGMLFNEGWIEQIDQVSERDWTKQGGKNVSKETRFTQAKLMCAPYHGEVMNNERYDEGRDISDSIMLGHWRLSFK